MPGKYDLGLNMSLLRSLAVPLRGFGVVLGVVTSFTFVKAFICALRGGSKG